jgi:XRE family transcriptional regulator, regulator of sulfur utilization
MIERNLGEVVRRLRESQHMSLRTLADKSEFSPSFISQVENGQASPSIASMERIAFALGVTLGQFFQVTEEKSHNVVKANDRPTLDSHWSKAKIEALGPISPGGTGLEPVIITINPGGTSGKRPHTQANEEFAIVFEGEVTVTLGEEQHALSRGDSVTIPPGTPRMWQNSGTEPVRIVVVSHRPRY